MSGFPAIALRALLLSLLLLSTSGCISSILAKTVIRAPNKDNKPWAVRDKAYRARLAKIYAEEFTVDVWPSAKLSVAVIEPGDYQLSYRVFLKTNQAGKKRIVSEIEWDRPDPDATPATWNRKTVLVLHGYRDSKENVLHWALALAEAGYRAVLVDFRGHGRSTGDVISYGAFEAPDLKQVITVLEERKLFTDKIGVLGVSYGASVGLLLAAQDDRVGTVVGLEPYSSAATGVVEFARGVAPSQTKSISDEQFQKGLELAEQSGGFRWSDADVLAQSASIKVPFLLFHGDKDTWLSPDNSRRLRANAPAGSKLGIVKGDNHMTLSLRLEPLRESVISWFNENLQAVVTFEHDSLSRTLIKQTLPEIDLSSAIKNQK